MHQLYKNISQAMFLYYEIHIYYKGEMMIIKYYWYINVSPTDENTDYSNLDSFVRRWRTVPQNNLFYITETIDDYSHHIREKGDIYPPTTYNDFGKPRDIKAIGEHIIGRLIEQWRKDHGNYISELRKTKKMLAPDENYMNPFEHAMQLELMEHAAYSRKKSPAIKKIKRRIKPKCACKKISRR